VGYVFRVGVAIKTGVGRRCVRALLASLGHFELISLPLGCCLLKQIDEPIYGGLLLIGGVLHELVIEYPMQDFSTEFLSSGRFWQVVI